MQNKYSYNLIKWSLRKLKLPIKSNALVLDVCSGSSPHPAADVVLEKYVDTTHCYEPLVADRPTVLADACKMPFMDKAFDYIIASHVLEHINTPELFLKELQRVGKAGYIETPNAIFEGLVPYNVHVLEIMNSNNELIIHKKSSPRPDNFINNLEVVKQIPVWNKFFYNNPELFQVRYFWNDKLNYKIVNPELNPDWINNIGITTSDEISTKCKGDNPRSLGLKLLRKIYKWRRRTEVNLLDILSCPECHSGLIKKIIIWYVKPVKRNILPTHCLILTGI